MDDQLRQEIQFVEEHNRNDVRVPLFVWRKLANDLADRHEHEELLAENLRLLTDEKVALQAEVVRLTGEADLWRGDSNRVHDYHRRGLEAVLSEVLADGYGACGTFAQRLLDAQREEPGRWRSTLLRHYPALPYDWLDVLCKHLGHPTPLVVAEPQVVVTPSEDREASEG